MNDSAGSGSVTGQKILFAADNHYDTHAGRVLYDCIKDDYDIEFHEDEWSCFEQGDLASEYSLIALNMISGACDVPEPRVEAEANLREYVEAGAPVLLLHGGSAAFWQWDWWRALVGLRWVRGDDADGFEASTHPREPYVVRVAKCRHPLCGLLQEVSMEEDEIYTDLEQTCATVTLMETTINKGTFPMCYEAVTEWGGKVVGYIPGHDAEMVRLAGNVANCRSIIDYLLAV